MLYDSTNGMYLNVYSTRLIVSIMCINVYIYIYIYPQTMTVETEVIKHTIRNQSSHVMGDLVILTIIIKQFVSESFALILL